MCRDTIEISTEVLARRVRSLTDHRVVPVSRLCPGWGRAVDRLRESVRKDLVHRACCPLWRRVICTEPEVEGISDVVAMQSCTVQPLVVVWAAVEQPAVAHDRVDHR